MLDLSGGFADGVAAGVGKPLAEGTLRFRTEREPRSWLRQSGSVTEQIYGDGSPSPNKEVALVAEIVVPLAVRDLTYDDLPACAWTGSATHLASMAAALDRVERGEVDYIAVCPPSGVPIGLTAVDYVKTAGAGTLWMVEVHEALRSCGIGTIAIRSAEQRIRARGLARAELAVEYTNPRARALYERLGYVAYGSKPDWWDEMGPGRSIVRYNTVCTLMSKELPRPAPTAAPVASGS